MLLKVDTERPLSGWPSGKLDVRFWSPCDIREHRQTAVLHRGRSRPHRYPVSISNSRLAPRFAGTPRGVGKAVGELGVRHALGKLACLTLAALSAISRLSQYSMS
ncbi:hypothetical protein E2E30_03580 [Sphingomonas sp. AAP5]|nr:hypothetical protein E2E30_03580 [Sphingomonas sp. AAP5]